MNDFRLLSKRSHSDHNFDIEKENYDGSKVYGPSNMLCRTVNRQDLHIAIISLLLLIPVYLLCSIQNTSQLAETLSSFTESEVTERLLLSKAVPSLKECKNPLRMAVPLLVSEQRFAARQPSIAVASIALQRKKPRVCVIATTYNVVDYVSIAVESVLQQTYQNVEIIVVDDNSNDGTTDLLLEKYATAPPGPDTTTPTLQVVRLTHNTNGGAGQPSNIGIDSCSEYTDYVMFADGDDYMELDAVETMLTHAEIFNSDIVMADFDVVMPLSNGTVVSEPSYDFRHWDEIPNDVPFNILTHPRVLRTSPVPWRKMYKRQMLMKYDLKFPE
jgi:Glycosyl transferase family 2